jgi:hypothetical protein
MNRVCSGRRGAALVSEGRKVAAILVADIVGYSRLMGEDEAGTAQGQRSSRGGATDDLQRGTVKANKYRQFSASSPAERGGNS